MSRLSAGNPQIREEKPTNNVYTVLSAVGLVAVIAALVVLFMRSNVLFAPGGLFG